MSRTQRLNVREKPVAVSPRLRSRVVAASRLGHAFDKTQSPVEQAYNYILQVLRMVMYFNPLRVLMPIGLTLLGATFVKGVADLIRHDLRVTGSTVLVGLAAFNIMAIALLADLVVRRTGTD